MSYYLQTALDNSELNSFEEDEIQYLELASLSSQSSNSSVSRHSAEQRAEDDEGEHNNENIFQLIDNVQYDKCLPFAQHEHLLSDEQQLSSNTINIGDDDNTTHQAVIIDELQFIKQMLISLIHQITSKSGSLHHHLETFDAQILAIQSQIQVQKHSVEAEKFSINNLKTTNFKCRKQHKWFRCSLLTESVIQLFLTLFIVLGVIVVCFKIINSKDIKLSHNLLNVMVSTFDWPAQSTKLENLIKENKVPF